MSIIVWLALGVAIGYLGSLILRTEADRGLFRNALIGTVGALSASWLMLPRMSVAASRGGFDLQTFLVSLLGAVVLVGVANVVRRGRLR